MHHRSVVLSLLLLPITIASAAAQGEVDARSPARKGSSAWFVHESVMAAKVAFGGQEIATTEKVAWTLHVRVTDVDEAGNFAVTTDVVRVRGKLEMAAGQGSAEFDSAGEGDGDGAPAARRAAAALTAVAGKSFQCKVGPRGQVLELGAGKEQIVDGRPRAGSMHEHNEALLRQWVEGAFGIVPDKRTAGGAKWDRMAPDFFGRMPVRQQLASTLTVVDPDFFEIESTGTVELDLAAAKELAKNDRAVVIGQIEQTKVSSSKVVARQKTSRQDGLVLAASRTVALEFTTTDPRMGEMLAHYDLTQTTSRTTEAEAKAKPAAAEAKK